MVSSGTRAQIILHIVETITTTLPIPMSRIHSLQALQYQGSRCLRWIQYLRRTQCLRRTQYLRRTEAEAIPESWLLAQEHYLELQVLTIMQTAHENDIRYTTTTRIL